VTDIANNLRLSVCKGLHDVLTFSGCDFTKIFARRGKVIITI